MFNQDKMYGGMSYPRIGACSPILDLMTDEEVDWVYAADSKEKRALIKASYAEKRTRINQGAIS